MATDSRTAGAINAPRADVPVERQRPEMIDDARKAEATLRAERRRGHQSIAPDGELGNGIRAAPSCCLARPEDLARWPAAVRRRPPRRVVAHRSSADEAQRRPTMDPNELTQQAGDALTVKRVFGEPYERNGVTVIPTASIRGGAGGGRGEGATPAGAASGSGSGGGFGLIAKPAGVYVIDGNKVRWQPAVDVNRIILGGQIVAIVLLFVLRGAFRHRR